jgi:hypothetical protein
MGKNQKNKSSYIVNQIDEGWKIICQGGKQRSAIYHNENYTEDIICDFVPEARRILYEFNLALTFEQFPFPSIEQLNTSVEYLDNICSLNKNRLALSVERTKKIKKPEHIGHTITYRHIRIHFQKYCWSKAAIADHFKLGHRTITKIINAYKSKDISEHQLDSTIINRSKSHRKYANESRLIDFLRNLSGDTNFNRATNVYEIIQKLHINFGSELNLKRSKVYALMEKAGWRRKKVKLNVIPNPKNHDLSLDQRIHMFKLLFSLSNNDFLVFLDETYVHNQMFPSRLWFRKEEDPIINVEPRDQRVTIVAAVSLFTIESFQMIYDSIDAVHYAIFLLSLKENLKRKYPNKNPIFIYDNARPHIGKLCSKIFNTMPFVRQSAWSPKMNFIEYIFGYFKKNYRKLTYNAVDGETQEVRVKKAFKMITRSVFEAAKYEMLDYLLITGKKEILKL